MNAETNKASCQSGFICLIAEIDVPITINSINLLSVFCVDTVELRCNKNKENTVVDFGLSVHWALVVLGPYGRVHKMQICVPR